MGLEPGAPTRATSGKLSTGKRQPDAPSRVVTHPETGSKPLVSGSKYLRNSVYYVMAGRDPAIHAAHAAPMAASIVRDVGNSEWWRRVDARIKSAHDEVGGKSREPDSRGSKPATVELQVRLASG